MGGFNVRLLISYYPDRALSPTCFPFFITSTPHTSSFNPLRSPQVIITVKYRHKSTDIPSQDEDWSIYKTAITHNFLPIPFISSSCFCCYWSIHSAIALHSTLNRSSWGWPLLNLLIIGHLDYNHQPNHHRVNFLLRILRFSLHYIHPLHHLHLKSALFLGDYHHSPIERHMEMFSAALHCTLTIINVMLNQPNRGAFLSRPCVLHRKHTFFLLIYNNRRKVLHYHHNNHKPSSSPHWIPVIPVLTHHHRCCPHRHNL